MKSQNVPFNSGTAIVLVTGHNGSGVPGFVATALSDGRAFEHFGRCLSTAESNKVVKHFGAWKKTVGPHEVVELNRGTAAVFFIEELALPAVAATSTVDLSNALLIISAVTGEPLDLKSRFPDQPSGMYVKTKQLATVYSELKTTYSCVAKVFAAASEIERVWRNRPR